MKIKGFRRKEAKFYFKTEQNSNKEFNKVK